MTTEVTDGAPARGVDVPLVIAAVVVVALVAVVVAFSLRGIGDDTTRADVCRAEAARVREAVAAYRTRHPSQRTPTAAELVSDGRLVVAPLRYGIEYAGVPPAVRLRPLAGSGC
jgi:hypothetical protein